MKLWYDFRYWWGTTNTLLVLASVLVFVFVLVGMIKLAHMMPEHIPPDRAIRECIASGGKPYFTSERGGDVGEYFGCGR